MGGNSEVGVTEMGVGNGVGTGDGNGVGDTLVVTTNVIKEKKIERDTIS
jgi:hypothetical protein